MSLRQIKHIGSVGRFRASSAEGDVTFKKFTLIFGENGRGKTTLCSILRSLQTNEPAIVVGRKTLGSGKDPHIVLTFADGAILYKDGSWTKPHTKLRIFDAQYVSENVYFGDEIGRDQRRNLCRVMLGKDGVALANSYDELDQAITDKNNDIKDVRKTLTVHVPTAQIDEFIGLAKDADIEKKVDAKAREIEGLKEIENLRTRATLQTLDLPPLPTRLEDILGKTLDGVSRDAEAKVKGHLAKHGMAGQEDWLAEGVEHAQDTCPFCDQSLNGLDLISAYRSFFNESYDKFLREQEQYRQLPSKHYSDDKIAVLVSRIESNMSNVDVWKRYVTFISPTLNENVAEVIATFRDEMIKLLEKKGANPLASVSLSKEYIEAYSALMAFMKSVEGYNDVVTETNQLIETFKRSATHARLQSAQNELKWLQLAKKRHEKPLSDACDEYLKLGKEKQALDKKKIEARKNLDTYSETVVETYRKSINTFLAKFSAGFHLQKLKVEYSGRVPNSTFCVVINDTEVAMGTSDTPLDEPSFRNTLSSGDKSTLALAFFMAQLKADAEKADCIVVFDDPFNSQDHYRRTCTITEIRRCGNDVSQVIVMSHDRHFLHEIWGLPLPPDDRKTLELVAIGKRDTVIAPWDIENDKESDDAANRRILVAFHTKRDGAPRDVVQKIRPIIESHIRRIAPKEMEGVTTLGAMLGKIRDVATVPEALKSAYDEIDDVNTYTRQFMHGDPHYSEAKRLSSDELAGFVEKVLMVVGH